MLLHDPDRHQNLNTNYRKKLIKEHRLPDNDLQGKSSLVPLSPFSSLKTGVNSLDKYKVIEAFQQGNLLKFTVSNRVRRTTASHMPLREAGDIHGFSRGSRMRLLQKMSVIDKDAVFSSPCLSPKFITLTYGQAWPDPETAKADLRRFLKRLSYHHFKSHTYEFSCLWRLEFQARGAPHFHLIIFGLPFTHKSRIRDLWGDSIGRQYWDTGRKDRPFYAPITRIERIKSYNGVMSYSSKYTAKPSVFNYRPYLSKDGQPTENGQPNTTEKPTATGRVWGIIGKKHLPLSEKHTRRLDRDCYIQRLDRIKRELSAVYGFKTCDDIDSGFSFFSEDAPALFKAFIGEGKHQFKTGTIDDYRYDLEFEAKAMPQVQGVLPYDP